MKLARKLTLALVVGILVVLTANALFRVQRELALFESDSRRDSLLLGRMLAGSVARLWPTIGEAQALDLVEDANQRESDVRIRWTWLDADVGTADGPEVRPAPAGPPFELTELAQLDTDTSGGALYTYVPVIVPGGRPGAIEVRDSRVNARVYIQRTLYQALLTTSLLVALCGGLAMGLGVVLVGRPVALLIEQARRIGGGDLSRRLSLRQRDEIGELADEMNTMVDLLARTQEKASAETSARIAALEQLRHADRLSTVGQLAAGIAHELGTPLNVVMGRAQLVSRSASADGEIRKNVTIIQEQTTRMTSIIRQLLDFARRREARKSVERLHAIALQTASMLSSLAKKGGVRIVVDGDEHLTAEVDAGQIQQALTNLVVNGIQAMPGGGTLRIRVERGEAAGGGLGPPRIAVEDEGCGVNRALRERIFEPFFTTKPPGEGTGLGLSVSYGIVDEHGGRVELHDRPDGGSCFAIVLSDPDGRRG